LARRRVPAVIAVLTTVIVGTAGVALASGPTRALASGPSRAQYIAKADAICASESKLLAPYAAEYSKLIAGRKANYAKAAVVLSQSNAIRSASLAKLRALPVPAGDRTTLADLWDVFDRLITDTDEIAMALGGSSVASVAEVDVDAELTGSKYQLDADAYGFKVCGARHG